jgi:hypothetical protein
MKSFRLVSVVAVAVAMLFGGYASAQETICINGKCYPVVSREVVSQSTATAEASLLRSDSRAFKRALLESARQARRSGEISLGQHLAVIAIAQRPAKLAEMQSSVHELAIEDGQATATAIDWMKLIEFIIKVLPELIAIFK